MASLLSWVVQIVVPVSKCTSYQLIKSLNLSKNASDSINTDQVTGEDRRRKKGGEYYLFRQKRNLFTMVLETWAMDPEDHR